MQENFDRSFDLVVGSEGVYDDDPDDRGNWTSGIIGIGELRGTKYGIAAHVYPYLDIKRLTIDKAKGIYRRDYWGGICDMLPSGVDYLYFDMRVNTGTKRAGIILQRALGVTADGLVGPQTLAAVRAANKTKLVNAVCDRRISFYQSLKMFWKYGRGWLNRVKRVRADAIAMANNTGD